MTAGQPGRREPYVSPHSRAVAFLSPPSRPACSSHSLPSRAPGEAVSPLQRGGRGDGICLGSRSQQEAPGPLPHSTLPHCHCIRPSRATSPRAAG